MPSDWQPACIIFGTEVVPNRSGDKMKFKFIAALLVLMTMAIPGAVIAQNNNNAQNDAQNNGQNGAQYPDEQMPDPNAKPSPNVQVAPAPSEQDMDPNSDQDSMGQGSMGQAPAGPNDTGPANPDYNNPSSGNSSSGNPTYNTPAPVENNGVGRISLIHGDVSTQRGDSGAWSAAALNAPLVAGDKISTGDKARTEVQLDYANTLRLAEHSQANLVQLTRSQIQIQLGHGMANYTVFGRSDADAEIDTPNVAIKTERRDSSFRILVTADDHTEVLVRKGEIEVTTPQGGTRVGQNQFITIQGTGADEQYKIGEAPARDDFDQWNTDRDNMIRNSLSRRETGDYYTGSQDLDNNGTWSEFPDYGPVWRPAVPPGWAPYRDGRWVYEPYWGWTWVSYDSWGWAPYHYGRWMYLNGGWGWWPGPVYGNPFYRPIWAPAYVGFFGWGPGFGVGVGFGFGFGFGASIGWLPLGPGDFFHPWWGRWGGGFGAVGWGAYNRGGFAPLRAGSRFSNVNLAMHDPNFRGGTTVSGRDFGTAHMNAAAMTHAQFQNARATTGRLPVSPSRESFSASGRPAAASTTRNVASNQHFFSTHGTVAAGARSADGRSFGGGETARAGNSGFSRPNEGGERSAEARGGSSAGREGGSSGGGWQHFTPMSPRSSSESGRSGESASRGDDRGYNSERSMSSQSRGYGSEGQSRGYGSEGRSYGSEGRSYGSEGRSYGSEGRSYGGSSRPPLNMRQPIVMPRSYGGGAYGRSAPGYGGRAPSYGGGRSAPSSHGGGAPHGGSSHGSAPHGGSSHGGGSHGGGGGHHGR
jgi:FecR protein